MTDLNAQALEEGYTAHGAGRALNAEIIRENVDKGYEQLYEHWLTMCGKIVDKTIMEADTDRDGKISFEEFTKMVENTDISMSMTLGKRLPPFS